MTFAELRANYHRQICSDIIRVTSRDGKEYPNFADSSSAKNIAIAWHVARHIGFVDVQADLRSGQGRGNSFEKVTRVFLEDAFGRLNHLRPGRWQYLAQSDISQFEQYAHLKLLEELLHDKPELASALGGDYIIKPDIVIARASVNDDEINLDSQLVGNDPGIATFSPLRTANSSLPCWLLHASISCKWTIRSDRSQNARTEALNLMRNRKGHVPHIVTITADPWPTRIAALALGTGDLDCVYHFALPELVAAVAEVDPDGQGDMLRIMIEGKRLRDISDLPLDLAI